MDDQTDAVPVAIPAFRTGELSPDLRGAIDLAKYHEMKSFAPPPPPPRHGGFSRAFFYAGWAALLGLLLLGCARPRYAAIEPVPPEIARRDMADCNFRTAAANAPPAVQPRMLDACMRAKGYIRAR